MTLAQEAYKNWKKLHKVNMQVYTDEQTFIIGFEYRDAEVKELSELIVDMMARLKEQKEEISRLTKPKKVKREGV